MKKITFGLLLVLISCASSMLPQEDRKLTLIKKTKMSKNKAYSTALAFISKNFGNSTKVVKIQDKNSGTIVLKGNTTCNIFRQSGDINDYLLNFTLEISIKNSKARLQYEDLHITGNSGNVVGWAYNQMSSKNKVKQTKKCLAPLSKGLFKSNDW